MQVDVGGVAMMIVQPAFEGGATIDVGINYTVPGEEKEAGILLHEKKLLGIFTGETGRVEVFRGEGMSEQIVLVLDQSMEGGKKGAVLIKKAICLNFVISSAL